MTRAQEESPCILLSGGGTGGHLAPGIAVAEELKARIGDARILFAGTGRPVEEHMVPAAGFELVSLPAVKLPRSILAMPAFPFRLMSAVRAAKRLLREVRPRIVIGLGGYGSVPAVRAAHKLRVPSVLLEQNSVPGVANRWLSRVAREVYVQFAASRACFPRSERVFVLGNPLRRGITEGSREAALKRFSLDANRKTLLVLGGSQGATHINEAVCDALPALAGLESVQVIHQSGARDEVWVRERHAEAGAHSAAQGFMDDMSDVLAAADLILCRAGATTLAEIAAVGLPSILVPFPHAAGDHQTLNARVYAEAGASVLVRDADLDGAGVVELTTELMQDDARCAAMAEAARTLAKPDATRDVCDRIMSIMESRS